MSRTCLTSNSGSTESSKVNPSAFAIASIRPLAARICPVMTFSPRARAMSISQNNHTKGATIGCYVHPRIPSDGQYWREVGHLFSRRMLHCPPEFGGPKLFP